jgi:hypothetical protein
MADFQAPPTQSFAILYSDDEDAMPAVIGQAAVDGDGRLILSAAVDEHCGMLEDVFNYVNLQDTLHVEVPPPAGARPHELFTAEVARGDAEFVDALKNFLQRYYDLELTTEFEFKLPDDLATGENLFDAGIYGQDASEEEADVEPKLLLPDDDTPPPRPAGPQER